MKFFCLLLLVALSTKAQLSFEEGDIKNPLIKFDIPFVPEEFRSSTKRIIFDKNDFVNLLPSTDLEIPLRDAILTILEKKSQHNTNDRKVGTGTYPAGM